MNEEYLRGLHGYLGIEDDYETWVSSVQNNEEYLKGLHGHLEIDDDFETWSSATWGKTTADSMESRLDSVVEFSQSGTEETEQTEEESSSLESQEPQAFPSEDIDLNKQSNRLPVDGMLEIDGGEVVSVEDMEISELYDAYERAGDISVPQMESIDAKIAAQAKGDFSTWETVQAYTQGFMAHGGLVIPIYDYMDKDEALYAAQQKNKIDFLTALPKDKVEELKTYADNRTQSLSNQNLNIVAENTMLESKMKTTLSDLEQMGSAIRQLNESGDQVPKEGAEEYLKVIDQFKALQIQYNENINLVESNYEDIGDAYEELDLLKKNYKGFELYADKFRLVTADLAVGLKQFYDLGGNPLMQGPNVAGLYENMEVREEIERQRGFLRPDTQVGDIDDMESFGMWAAEQVTNQLPILLTLGATGGTAGLALLSSATAGGKAGDMMDSNFKGESDYNGLEILLTSIGHGAAEYLSERVSLGILSKGNRTLKASLKGRKPSSIKSSMANSADETLSTYAKIKKGAGKYGTMAVSGAWEEGSAEFANTISQNLMDILAGDEDVRLFDGAVDAFASGGFMGKAMQAAPALIGLGLRTYTSKAVSNQLKRNTQDLEALAYLLEADPNLSDDTRMVLQDKMQLIMNSSKQLIDDTVGNLSRVGKKGLERISEIDKKVFKIRKSVVELEDSDLPTPIKTELKAEKKAEVDSLKEEKETILESGSKQDGKSQVQQDIAEAIEEGAVEQGGEGTTKVQGEDAAKRDTDTDVDGVRADKQGDKVDNDGGATQEVAKEPADIEALTKEKNKLEEELVDIEDDAKAEQVEARIEELNTEIANAQKVDSKVEAEVAEEVSDVEKKVQESGKAEQVNKLRDKYYEVLDKQFKKEESGKDLDRYDKAAKTRAFNKLVKLGKEIGLSSSEITYYAENTRAGRVSSETKVTETAPKKATPKKATPKKAAPKKKSTKKVETVSSKVKKGLARIKDSKSDSELFDITEEANIEASRALEAGEISENEYDTLKKEIFKAQVKGFRQVKVNRFGENSIVVKAMDAFDKASNALFQFEAKAAIALEELQERALEASKELRRVNPLDKADYKKASKKVEDIQKEYDKVQQKLKDLKDKKKDAEIFSEVLEDNAKYFENGVDPRVTTLKELKSSLDYIKRTNDTTSYFAEFTKRAIELVEADLKKNPKKTPYKPQQTSQKDIEEAFGLSGDQSNAAAAVADAMIEVMAEREGISVEEMKAKIEFKKSKVAPDGSLKQEAEPTPQPFYSLVGKAMSKLAKLQPSTPEVWVKKIIEAGGRGTAMEAELSALKANLAEYLEITNSMESQKSRKTLTYKEVLEAISAAENIGIKVVYTSSKVGKSSLLDRALTKLGVSKKALKEAKGKDVQYGYYEYNLMGKEVEGNRSEILITLPQETYGVLNEDHFQAEGDSIVGWTRNSVRVAPDGKKVLMIEEFQSDWAQAQRKYGVEGESNPKVEKAEEQYFDAIEAFKAIKDRIENSSEISDLTKTYFKYAFDRYDAGSADSNTDAGSISNALNWIAYNEMSDKVLGKKDSANDRALFNELVKANYNLAKAKLDMAEAKSYGLYDSQVLEDAKASLEKLQKDIELIDKVHVALTKTVPSRLMESSPNVGWLDFSELSREIGASIFQGSLKDGLREILFNKKSLKDYIFEYLENYESNFEDTLTPEESRVFKDLRGIDSIANEIVDLLEKGEYFDRTNPHDLFMFDAEFEVFEENTYKPVKTANPYSKNNAWIPLVFRKTLQAAIEQGLDVIAWTTGQQQSARWAQLMGANKKGLETFYNSIVPKAVLKEVKRYDKNAKIEVIDLDPSNTSDDLSVGKQLSITITPAMRMAMRENGVPLFQNGQSPQGAMSVKNGKYIVHAITNPNVTTPLHELSHVFEDYLTEEERAIVRAFAETGNEWTVETSEKFARGFEKYLSSGKVPNNPQLAEIFKKFKDWLTDIYNGIQGSSIDIELNPAMEAIYEKMLTPKSQVREVHKEVKKMIQEGKTAKEILAEFTSKSERMQAKNSLKRLLAKPLTPEKALEKAKKSYDKAKAKAKEKKKVNLYKQAVFNMAKWFTDRQYLPKRMLKKAGGELVRDYMVASKGSPGFAKRMFDKAYDKIYRGLNTEELNDLNLLIMQRRFMAIDKNRAKRGLDPVTHPDFQNLETAEATLEGLRKRLGDKKFDDLNNRATEYFNEFRGMLDMMVESGIINQEFRDSFFDVDYQPRLFLKFLQTQEQEISIQEMGAPMSTSLTSKQVQTMEKGSDEALVVDSMYLLGRSFNMRAKTTAQNKVNQKLESFMKERAKYIKELKEKRDNGEKLKKKEKGAIKHFEALSKRVVINPIIGFSESGNPKYKLSPEVGQRVLSYYKDGVKHQMLVEEEFYDQYMDNLKGVFTNSDVREKAAIASGTALVKGIATGNNPAFFLTNFPRDLFFVASFSKEYGNRSGGLLGGYNPFAPIVVLKDFAISVRKIFIKDSSFENFVKYGGMMDFLHTQGEYKGTKGLRGLARTKISNKNRDLLKKIGNILTLKGVQTYSEIGFRLAVYNKSLANSLRLSEYKKMEDVPADLLEDWNVSAVAAARSLTDFNQGGIYAKDLDAVTPYLNAGIQGTRSAVDAIAESPGETLFRMISTGTLLASAPLAIATYFIAKANWGEDDEEMAGLTSAGQYYKALEGVSRYDRTNYMIIFTGGRDERGEYVYWRIAKPHFITPASSLASNIMENYAREMNGMRLKTTDDLKKDLSFAFEKNISPVDFGILGNVSRTPLLKASLTYALGYDFYREQPLSYKKGKVMKEAEGFESRGVEDFYKIIGENEELSPARLKGAIESLITTPSTSAYIAALYGGADYVMGDKDLVDGADKMLETLEKSVLGRLRKTTSEFNRRIDWEERLKSEFVKEDVKNLKDAFKLKQMAIAEKNKEISRDEVVNYLNEIGKKDIFEMKRLMNTYTDMLANPGVSPIVSELKYRTPYQRALILAELFGDELLEQSDMMSKENSRLQKEIFVTNILNDETVIKYQELIKKIKK